MKIAIVNSIIIIMLFTPQINKAQGTITYLSNLGQLSAGSLDVGSDSWLAEPFITGTNVEGYALNSIQLSMADASGNASGFTVMLYTSAQSNGSPASNLSNFSGSSDPATSGIYTYSPISTFTLLPDTLYFIVLTAGTAVANNDAFEWSLASTHSYNQTGQWFAGDLIGIGGIYASSNGSSWSKTYYFYPQYDIRASVVPEPSISLLLLLSGGVLIYVRRKFIH
jgi:hypothetical protein